MRGGRTGRGRGAPRGGHNSRGGRGGRTGGRGNADLAAEETGDMTEADYNELVELHQLKQRWDSSSATGSSATGFTGFARTGSGVQALASMKSASTKKHVEWIVDSGASKHITGTRSEFR